MSKIGRKPINFGNVQVEVKGQEVHYKGKTSSGVHALPEGLGAQVENKQLIIVANKAPNISNKASRDINRVWGLNRALLANKMQGADIGFVKKVRINGLGYKAVVSGKKVVFSLGFSHKINFELPQDVSLEVDKSGQLLTFKSYNNELVGQVCGLVRALRPPEPYKGTGVKLENEVIRRKAGKTKSS